MRFIHDVSVQARVDAADRICCCTTGTATFGGTDVETNSIYLSREQVEPAHFALPDPARLGDYALAACCAMRVHEFCDAGIFNTCWYAPVSSHDQHRFLVIRMSVHRQEYAEHAQDVVAQGPPEYTSSGRA